MGIQAHLPKRVGWPCPVRSALKRTPVQDFNYFSIMFYYIISTTYKKLGDLFCPIHISGLSHSVTGLSPDFQLFMNGWHFNNYVKHSLSITLLSDIPASRWKPKWLIGLVQLRQKKEFIGRIVIKLNYRGSPDTSPV